MSKEVIQHEVDVAIVGGGPVGALLACALTDRGFTVEVYEKRKDLRNQVAAEGRSINLALSTRGLRALKQAGLEEEALKLTIPMPGRMVHNLDGSLVFAAYGKDESEHLNSISRKALNELLLSHTEKQGTFLHFDHKVLAVDVENNCLSVFDAELNRKIDVYADLIVGSDGSASVIRDKLASEGHTAVSEEQLDYGYKELVLPAGSNNSCQIERNALHIWPRGSVMLIALPNLDGSFTCTLFLPFVGEISFEHLQSPEAVTRFFEKYFPDALRLMPNLTADFFENPVGHMSTVKCETWQLDGRVLLIGDAAHAIVPFFGQGMNCGFEDVFVLDQCMDDHMRRGGALYLDRRQHGANTIFKRQKEGSSGWDMVFGDFCLRRKANADAIADLAVENFVEMRDKVANPQFMLEKAVERRLQNEFPQDFMSRYRLVTFTNVPYSFARTAGEVTDSIVQELSKSIKSADEVDLKLAEKLIRSRLSPMLRREPELVAGGLR